MPTLKIVTFGHTRVTIDGQDIVWHASSARDLFFYLLSFPDGRSQRDVAQALWPDEENENAASSNRFRVALHRVRTALGKTESVFKDYERYRLSPEVLATSDVFAMQVALHEAQLAGTGLPSGTQATREALQRAADLYGGEYLTEVRTDWADTVREEYKASYVRATLELSMLHCEAAECELAIRHLAQALRADPLIGENYHQDLMACLASVESKYAAVEHYRRFIKYLRSDLADTPMLETTALAERLKESDFTCPHQIGSHAPCARHLAQRAVGATLLSFEPDGSEVHDSLERAQLGLKLADALQPAGTLDEVAHLTLEALGAALKLESLFIFLVDFGVLRINRVWGEIPPELHPLLELGALPLDAVALCRQVVQTGEAQYAENISLLLTAEPETKPTAAGAVPIVGQSGTLEAVLAVSRPPHVGTWTVHEQALLTQAARTLGFTLRQDALYIGVPNSGRRESLPVTGR
ncbi:GAF domain-containing protein [Deinococcus psychrotolerans]|uniref:GAF domain-containing protein n=1 Tax=Deinococcus psychrotolerans TaxID=2489213 RepID=A0A3G8YR88_9DEIO|nr:BTAD domain-containing putative transcriptional regulator [Deinococcus psychrotolerans]AZI44241.1 GAF domain-containing protein [Deinococcus psychrotolerans]